MKIAIISDIHANLGAFSAVLDDCFSNFNDIKFINLGDFVDYNMQPNEVIEELIKLEDKVLVNIKGNHEKALFDFGIEKFSSKRGVESNLFTRKILNETSWKYIKNTFDSFLELEIENKKILCVHDSMTDIFWGKMTQEEMQKELYQKYDYVLSGHSHKPHFEKINNAIFINPSSVGQPRNSNPKAQYAILDLKKNEVDFRCVEYDIKAQQALFTDELDIYYKERLSKGI